MTKRPRDGQERAGELGLTELVASLRGQRVVGRHRASGAAAGRRAQAARVGRHRSHPGRPRRSNHQVRPAGADIHALSGVLYGPTLELRTIPRPEPSAAAPTAPDLSLARMIRFVAGRGVAALGDEFLLFAIPLLILKTTGSASLTGLGFLIEWLPRVLFMPVAGALADRVGGYRLYLLADAVRATLAFAAFVLVLTWTSGRFGTLAVLAAGMSLAGAQAYLAMETSLPRFVPDSQMVRAQATIQATEQGSAVLGPALAAVLAAFLDTTDLLLVIGGLFVLTALNTCSLRRLLRVDAPAGPRPTVRSLLGGVGEGARLLRRMPTMVGLVVLTMTVNLMIGVGMSTAAAITTKTFAKPDGWFGTLSTTAAVLSLATFFVVPSIGRFAGSFFAILGSFAMISLGGLVVSQARTFVSFALGYAVLVGTVGVLNVFVRAERIRRIPQGHLGKVIGVWFLLNQSSLPLAGGIVALFVNRIGPQSVVLASVIVSVVVAAALLPLLVRLRTAVSA